MNAPCTRTHPAADVPGVTVTRVGSPSAGRIASSQYWRWLRNIWFSVAAVLAVFLTTPVHAVDLARGFGGAYVQAVAADNLGQTYIAGYFSNPTITLGTQVLTRLGSEDAFVAKLDAAGDVLWARNFGGAVARAQAVVVDSLGQVYLAGYNMGGMFDPTLPAIGPQDAFAMMLSADGQTVVWAKSFGGSTAQTSAFAMAIDASSNIYLGGTQSGSLTQPTLPQRGFFDAFAFKLDSTGAVTWARNFGGTGASANGWGIAVDATSNVYLTGGFEGADLTTPPLTKLGLFDAFAIKLTSTGSTSWSHNFGGIGASTYASGVAVDSTGDVYVAGTFCCANLTTPALTRISTDPTYSDAFVIKLRGSGERAGRVQWATNFGGATANTAGVGVAVGPADNVYFLGDYGFGNITTPAAPLAPTPIGPVDAFYFRLDHNTGGVAATRSFGGASAAITPTAITVDGYGNVVLGGYFNGGDMTVPPIVWEGENTGFAIREFNAGLPFATVGPTTGITRTGATLNGKVWSNGTATTVFFEYGLTNTYGTSVAAVPPTLGSTAVGVAVTAVLNGLQCENTYYYRVKVTNGTATTYSTGLSFTTPSCVFDPPSASTHEATAISADGATLNGLATANGDITMVWFQYGLTTAYKFQTTPAEIPADATDVEVSAALTGLACNTVYHFQTVAENRGGRAYGEELRFVTEPCGPASVTVKPLGTGIGWVTSTPAGIDCGPACSAVFSSGTTVTLTADPRFYESVFTGWGGGVCEGLQTLTCTLLVTDVAKVTASFGYRGTTLAFSEVQDAYIGYYGRPAEPQGRAFWAGVTDEMGQGLTPIIDAFGNSPEFTRRYGWMTNAELITSMYNQLFARLPDPVGYNYWLAELDSGRQTLQRITLSMIYGAQGDDVVTFENKRSVANYYSLKVAFGCPYGPEQDGVDILSIVNLNPASVAEAYELIDTWCDQPDY